MRKTKAQLLADFKKSNKVRRERLAELAGYASADAYLAYLEGRRKVTTKKKVKEMLDYVVAFDTTGSMAAYIGDVKKHVQSLIPEMFSQDIDLKMKIIAFGDYCDMESVNKFGKAYQESNFTDNQNELISFVNNAKSTSGGDSDEFYELVIKKITEETPWRKGSKRAVLFIADCNPHAVGYYYRGNTYNINWKDEAIKAAKLNIGFDTLSIHGDSYKWYKELSEITNGVYMPFKSSNKMAEVVKASAYSRGSARSKATFAASFAGASAAGDEELVATYTALSKKLL